MTQEARQIQESAQPPHWIQEATATTRHYTVAPVTPLYSAIYLHTPRHPKRYRALL
ncbi:MAG: hypothetical protein OXL96_12850 [Candidatus Poribacteria bacterium]|nr:hypothetical protein [Candidatus Poribacteria bacterium]